ncbi:MAG: MFS transporter [Lacunisphaera sp.]|nr:MFS transporter [Lacunisphaera sp.]
MLKSRHPVPARAWLLLLLAGVAGMLFYIDRQTLSVLKPTLKVEMGWSDTHYSWLVTAFMVPYTLCYLVTGQLIDRWGTRLMMPLFLGVMSVATMLTGLAGNLWTMAACRFVLGAAEAGIVPAVLVAIVTWFPRDLRGTANTFNKPLTVSGQILVAPLAAWITAGIGWRWAFLLPGLASLIAARMWWTLDRSPPEYGAPPAPASPPTYREVIRTKAIRGVLLARIISDPLWFFLIFWQPGFLQEELGMTLEKFGQVGWIPAAASVGFIMVFGVTSDWLIRRGWSPAASRIRILMAVSLLSPAILVLRWVDHHGLAITLLTIVQVMTATWLSMTGLLMSDLVPRRMVGTAVAIMSAFGAAMGTVFNLCAGPLIESVGYSTLLVLASLLHPLAAGILWWNYGHSRTGPDQTSAADTLAPQPLPAVPPGR